MIPKVSTIKTTIIFLSPIQRGLFSLFPVHPTISFLLPFVLKGFRATISNKFQVQLASIYFSWPASDPMFKINYIPTIPLWMLWQLIMNWLLLHHMSFAAYAVTQRYCIFFSMSFSFSHLIFISSIQFMQYILSCL